MQRKNAVQYKGKPRYIIWWLVPVACAIIVIMHFSMSFVSAQNGVDIVFRTRNINRIDNLFAYDIDDSTTGTTILTDFQTLSDGFIESTAKPQNAGWLAYIVNEPESDVIKRTDVNTGHRDTLYECDNDLIIYCWWLHTSPNGRYLAFGSNLADPDNGAEVAVLLDLENPDAEPVFMGGEESETFGFIDDDRVVYWSYDDPTASIYNISTGTSLVTEIDGYYLDFNPTGTHVVQTNDRETDTGEIYYEYKIHDLSDGSSVTYESNIGNMIHTLVRMHPDGKHLLINDALDGAGPEVSQLVILDLETQDSRVIVYDPEYRVLEAEWHPDGNRILFTWQRDMQDSFDAEIWIYDLELDTAYPTNQIGSWVNWAN